MSPENSESKLTNRRQIKTDLNFSLFVSSTVSNPRERVSGRSRLLPSTEMQNRVSQSGAAIRTCF
ncbi:hypothetical protein OROMI_003550 [Orobanche minor]